MTGDYDDSLDEIFEEDAPAKKGASSEARTGWVFLLVGIGIFTNFVFDPEIVREDAPPYLNEYVRSLPDVVPLRIVSMVVSAVLAAALYAYLTKKFKNDDAPIFLSLLSVIMYVVLLPITAYAIGCGCIVSIGAFVIWMLVASNGKSKPQYKKTMEGSFKVWEKESD